MKRINIKLKRSCLDCDYCKLEIEKIYDSFITELQVLRCEHANVCKKYMDGPNQTISDYLEEKKEWFLPGERLPEDDAFVLVQLTEKATYAKFNNKIQLGSYYKKIGWVIDGYCDLDEEVVAWQPLPEAYEEG